jgi:DNA-binding response OmpR family regulator
MSRLVLIVEDERKIRELVRRYLERDGLAVLSTGSGAEAITIAAEAHPDLVVLDLGLPDVPSETVAREIRAGSDVPTLMLPARSDDRDRIAGLELGPDDYVTKPFSPRELTLRVQAILRRGTGSGERAGTVSYGGGLLRIDEQRHRVAVRDVPLELTPTEWGLLTALACTPGRATRAMSASTACADTSSRVTSGPSTPTSRICAAGSRPIPPAAGDGSVRTRRGLIAWD